MAASQSADLMEPATPPASLQREDDAAGPAVHSEFAWEGYPQVIHCILCATSSNSTVGHSQSMDILACAVSQTWWYRTVKPILSMRHGVHLHRSRATEELMQASIVSDYLINVQVGAQWAVQDEVIQIGDVTADFQQQVRLQTTSRMLCRLWKTAASP